METTKRKASVSQPVTSNSFQDPVAESTNKAYQSVAQSTAIAIQDATDHLRNMNTISSTALGVAMAEFLKTGDPKHAEAIELSQKIASNAASNFLLVSTHAADVLKGFPSK